MSFDGKVALVTGGTSGIGRETAIEFAKAGAKVVLAGRRQQEGEAVVDEITSSGGDAHFVRADVTQEDQVKHLVSINIRDFDPVGPFSGRWQVSSGFIDPKCLFRF